MLKLGWVGACRTAETAERAPASAQVIAETRDTEIPHSRAASGLLAAALIPLPSVEYRKKSASPTTSAGTSTAVRIHMPLSTTWPMRTWETNGCGYDGALLWLGPSAGTKVSAR